MGYVLDFYELIVAVLFYDEWILEGQEWKQEDQ